MTDGEFKVGQVLANPLGQYTKIISVKNGIYGHCGWTSRKAAEKATVAHKFVNKFGLRNANARAVSKSSASSSPATGKTGAKSAAPKKTAAKKTTRKTASKKTAARKSTAKKSGK